MAELDFTALNQLAYKGFETAEEQEKKDALIEQGFTIVEDNENPFTAPQTASERRSVSATSSPSRQDKRPEEPQRAPQSASQSLREAQKRESLAHTPRRGSPLCFVQAEDMCIHMSIHIHRRRLSSYRLLLLRDVLKQVSGLELEEPTSALFADGRDNYGTF